MPGPYRGQEHRYIIAESGVDEDYENGFKGGMRPEVTPEATSRGRGRELMGMLLVHGARKDETMKIILKYVGPLADAADKTEGEFLSLIQHRFDEAEATRAEEKQNRKLVAYTEAKARSGKAGQRGWSSFLSPSAIMADDNKSANFGNILKIKHNDSKENKSAVKFLD
ncbi:hypothetical protein B0H19DRAFT_1061765 [Mycena capillaripes]|nr:hypothetical protein B0H19DRAFT_1061765 [Mycena capillaripes]